MTGAVRALVPVVFQRTDLIRIQAGIFSDKLASMQVLGKSGFVREAVHRNAITKHGVVKDEVMYARLRDKNTETDTDNGDTAEKTGRNAERIAFLEREPVEPGSTRYRGDSIISEEV